MEKLALFDKILGAWTGKVAAGTFGQPVEGKRKDYIQKLYPPLGGWTPLHLNVTTLPNDDEQFELLVLLALEDLNDKDFIERLQSNTLLEPDYLGSYWIKYLKPRYIFTAEKYAYEFVEKHKLPWKHAGDDLYINPENNKAYGNPFFDWIGAQMKGEICGMLCPAWNWYSKRESSPKEDLEILKPCLDLSLQDALIAHRGVAIIGELFVSAMIAVAIVHDPLNYKETMTYPGFANDLNKAGEESQNEEIEQIGICSERIISDIKRIKAALHEYDKVEQEDVDLYFSYIEPVISHYEEDSNPAMWEKPWEECMVQWYYYGENMIKNAIEKYKDYPDIWNERVKELHLSKTRVHTLFNNSAIVIGLLYGDGDFTQTCRIATECGFDTDCNAGNAGAIIGAYIGQRLIPSYIKRFTCNNIEPAIKEWNDKSIKNLAKRTLTQAKRFKKFLQA